MTRVPLGWVDPLVGPIVDLRRMKEVPEEPELLKGYLAQVAPVSNFLDWKADSSGTGFGFDDAKARYAACGEAFERYSGNFCDDDDLLLASAKQLRDRGLLAKAPASLYPFSPTQAAMHKRFGQPDDSTKLAWVACEDGRGAKMHLPAALIYLNFYSARPTETRHFPVVLPGIAAGQTQQAATRAAVTEILERDATMLWWVGGRSATRLRVDASMARRIESPSPQSFSSSAWLLATYSAGVRLYVVAYVLRDVSAPSLHIGFACRPSKEEALEKAVAEAWQLRRIFQQVRNPDSEVWNADRGAPPLLPLKPFDASGDYTSLDDYSTMTQLVHNLQFYVSERRQRQALARIEELSDGTEELVSTDQGDIAPHVSVNLGELKAAHGMQTYFRDLTTPDIAELGVHVVRVFSPEACPNMPAAFPPLGNERLTRQLSAQGESACLLPLPHA